MANLQLVQPRDPDLKQQETSATVEEAYFDAVVESAIEEELGKRGEAYLDFGDALRLTLLLGGSKIQIENRIYALRKYVETTPPDQVDADGMKDAVRNA